jgi:hypothetical protein
MQPLARGFKELRGSESSDKLSAALAKSDASKLSLRDVTDLLSELDPELDSVAFLFVLSAASTRHRDNHEALLSGLYLGQFCTFCSVAGSESIAPVEREHIYNVSRAVTDACTKMRSLQHILAAGHAIFKFVSSSRRMLDSICPLHVDALQLTLLGASLSPIAQVASLLTASLPIVSDHILFPFEELPNAPQKSPLRVQEHVMAYFYYSGCVFCGLSNFEAAADRFFLCVSAGSHQGTVRAKEQRDSFGRDASSTGPHEIVDAAHKKLVLACLLSDNDDLSCLKHVPLPPARFYNSSDDSLVNAFSSCRKGKGSLNALRQTITRHHDTFEMDGNLELVMRLQDAYLLQTIRAQSSTCAAVNVLQLCSDLNLPDSVKIPDCITALIEQVLPYYSSLEPTAHFLQGKLKATLQGTKLTFLPGTGFCSFCSQASARVITRHYHSSTLALVTFFCR